MTTFTNISFDEFMRSASDFFKATQDPGAITVDQAENGNKTLFLLLFGHDPSWTVEQKREALMVLELSTARCTDIANQHTLREMT